MVLYIGLLKINFLLGKKIIEFQDVIRRDGKSACKIIFDKKLYKVAGIAHRPFQGWRYLTQEKVPQDIFSDKNNNEIPSSMMAELNEFGIL
jgi:hypothetical protein